MAPCVDGFVLPIPQDRIEEDKGIAAVAAEVWKDHGALDDWECTGDDLRLEGTRSFLDLAGAKEGETVVVAWVVFESREARDAANEAIRADPRLAKLMDPENPIFDGSRMAWGGFRSIVRLPGSEGR